MQLVARILAALAPAERLGSAALVATAWRTAAVLGTDTVSLTVPVVEPEDESGDSSGVKYGYVSEDESGNESGDEQEGEPGNVSEEESEPAKPVTWPERCGSLSAWLAANSNAGITGVSVSAPVLQHMPVLQLPSLQRLPGLECLACDSLAITAAQDSSSVGSDEGDEPEAEAALPPVELSPATALTALQFVSCRVEVRGLSTLTRLQSLALGPPSHRPGAVISNLRSQLQQALPQLQALVFLRLFGEVAHDDVLQHVSSLLRLQDLTLVGGMFTLASFRQLPQSLTHLSISWASSKRGRETSSQEKEGLAMNTRATMHNA